MASKTKVTPQKEEMLEKEGPETSPDSPLLDLSDAQAVLSETELLRAMFDVGYLPAQHAERISGQ
jgi:hypothetical protein